MISLMLCDDHISVLEAVAGELSTNKGFTICGKASSGQICIDLINSGIIPDILILDISMPNGINGYEVARHVQKLSLPTKIIAFSSFDDLHAIKAMVRFGAKGFVCKNDPIEDLKLAINIILKDEFYFTKNMVFSNKDITAMQKHPIAWAENITHSELKMVKLMQDDLALKEVANSLEISPSAASKKRKSLFKKTNTKSTNGLIGFLRKVGILP